MYEDQEDFEPQWRCPSCEWEYPKSWKCPICGKCRDHCCKGHLSLDDGGAAEEQLRLNRENPWDSEAERNLTRSLRVFRRWEES